MTTNKDMILDALDRAEQRLERALDGVTLEQANTFPAPEQAPTIKSLTWLTWHTAREIDTQLAPLAGTEPLWTSERFRERFALDLPDDTPDYRHTPEEASKVVAPSLELPLEYLHAAVAAARQYLRGLDEGALDDVVDESWTPAVTRASRLVSIIDDAIMHSGQAVYTRRLLGLED